MNKPFAELMQERTLDFARDILLFSKSLGKDYASKVLVQQLIRSASSTAANYRATCRARSGKEFFAKLSITIEEADETVFWLELLHKSELSKGVDNFQALLTESQEIRAVLATARKTYRKKNQTK